MKKRMALSPVVAALALGAVLPAGAADVSCFATNLANWTLRLTTNSPTGVVDLSEPRAPGTERMFYRARAVQ
jgi:hypothetical protein